MRLPFDSKLRGYWLLLIFPACLVTLHGAEDAMAARFYHIGGLPPRVSTTSSVQNFQGRLQGLVINGERILDEAHLKQIDYEGRKQFAVSSLKLC